MTSFVPSSDSDFEDELHVVTAPVSQSKASAEHLRHTGSVSPPHASSIISPCKDVTSEAPGQMFVEDPEWVKEFTSKKNCSLSEKRHRRTIDVGIAVAQGIVDSSSPYIHTRNGSSDSVFNLISDDSLSALDTANVTADVPELAVDSSGPTDEPSRATIDSKSSKIKSSLPLVTAPKLDENLVLVQAQSEAFDLSGDVGAVGRVKMNSRGMFLDIKGVLYSCGVVPINTVCVVSVDDNEARVSAVLDEAVILDDDDSLFNAGEQLLFGALENDMPEGFDAHSKEQTGPSGHTPSKAKSNKGQNGQVKVIKKAKKAKATKSATKPKR